MHAAAVPQVSDLWVSYHGLDGGRSSVQLSLPHVVGIDARPGVLPEHSLVISAGAPQLLCRQSFVSLRRQCNVQPLLLEILMAVVETCICYNFHSGDCTCTRLSADCGLLG